MSNMSSDFYIVGDLPTKNDRYGLVFPAGRHQLNKLRFLEGEADHGQWHLWSFHLLEHALYLGGTGRYSAGPTFATDLTKTFDVVVWWGNSGFDDVREYATYIRGERVNFQSYEWEPPQEEVNDGDEQCTQGFVPYWGTSEAEYAFFASVWKQANYFNSHDRSRMRLIHLP